MSPEETRYLPPEYPPNEEDRLEDLYSLKILDTASESKFDHYTQFIAELLDMPYALITLVDRDRQWFKSAHGLDLSETPREISFCGHTILEDEIFIVPDTLEDERFKGNPLVKGDPGIRFYAGTVIKGLSGYNIGTCCIIDSKPRQLTSREEQLLIHLGRIVQQEVLSSHEIRELRDRLQKTALFDPLSDLPNRTLFLDRLNFLIKDSEESGRSLLLVLIRFDQYDRLEGSQGRQEASNILGRFRSGLIQAAGPNAFLGRWEDDTLSLAVPMESASLDVIMVLDRVMQQLGVPIEIDGTSRRMIISIGACLYPDEAKDADELLQHAITALRSNPDHESIHHVLFSTDIKSRISRIFEIEQRLRKAVQRDELYLAFQPKVNITTGKICGSEALLRWDNAELGSISPGEFIPIAEQSGLIISLGEWVLREACEQMNLWSNDGLDPLPVSANVTSLQLREGHFHDNVRLTLEDTGISPHLLKLEVTESLLIEDIDGAIEIMKRMKKEGIAFSIDDFGTGFSSLGYLANMPVDELKIDKSFVDDITTRKESASIIQGLIMLAHSVGLKVVAEGVESEEQLTYLRAYQCDEIQGYLFSPPVKPEEFAGMVRGNLGI